MAYYPFADIEKKWQDHWQRNQTFKVTEDPAYPKEKRAYVLDMFPYPSGNGLRRASRVTPRPIFMCVFACQGIQCLTPHGL